MGTRREHSVEPPPPPTTNSERPRPKEVPGSLRSHSWTVLLPHQEENQPETGRRALLLREQRDPTHLSHHGLLVPGAPRRGLFPVHCILRRVCVRRGVEQLFICLRQLSAKLDPFEAKRFRARLSQKLPKTGMVIPP